jgi:peptidoglycan/xylan/chitin deacetylase (PgdA/CDA1 family)
LPSAGTRLALCLSALRHGVPMRTDDPRRCASTGVVGSAGPGLSRRGLLAALATVPMAAIPGCNVPPPAISPPPPPNAAAVPPVPVTSASGAPAGGPAAEVTHAWSGRPEVALTFHGAGDPELARQILAGLADRGAAVTVLAIGSWLEQFPDAARLVIDHGHELGNHTWSHPDLARLDESALRAEIERCRDRLVALTGGPGAFFRPSATQHATERVRRLAGAAGYLTVLSYDVDSRDYTDPGAASIRRNVRAAVAGSVVSMHLGHPRTLEAIPGLLEDLTVRGLRPVTASRLFS